MKLIATLLGVAAVVAAVAVIAERNTALALGGAIAQVPNRFGIGRGAAPGEIAAIDIDVRPDGTGLPDDSGTVGHGLTVYREKCEACHGPTGTEGPYDILVGRVPNDEFPFATDPRVRLTIGNFWPYATTVYDYIYRAMPFDAPGSLTARETYSLTALLLHWNDIIPRDAVMSRETLPAVEMPAHDRFVPDNRTGGPVIR